MLNCLKNIALISSCFLLWSCDSSERSPLKADLIRQLLDSLYHARVFNGAIVVAEGDSIIFSRGYGYANFEDSIPFTVNTTSDGGSLTKPFTAITVRRLAEAGWINLDDEVTKYLPQYPYPATRIVDLITHHAGGLPDYDYYFSKLDDTTVLTNH